MLTPPPPPRDTQRTGLPPSYSSGEIATRTNFQTTFFRFFVPVVGSCRWGRGGSFSRGRGTLVKVLTMASAAEARPETHTFWREEEKECKKFPGEISSPYSLLLLLLFVLSSCPFSWFPPFCLSFSAKKEEARHFPHFRLFLLVCLLSVSGALS